MIAGRGFFELRLLPDEAPVTSSHIATLAREGYYNGLTFHRVAPNFVLQGGSPGANEYAGQGPFMRDEVGLVSHRRGTVGISTRGRDTGDAQIFINLVDSPRLDHTYTVFAEVTSGIDVVDRILEGDVIERVDVIASEVSIDNNRDLLVKAELSINATTRTLDALRRRGIDVVDLTVSNPTAVGFDYPADLLAPLASPESLSYDPQPMGLWSAREAVAGDFLRRGLSIPPDRVALTASTSEAYAWLFKLLCDPGDAVLIPQPSYPLFEHLTMLESVAARPYRLDYHSEWRIDLDGLVARHRRPDTRGARGFPEQPDRLVSACGRPATVGRGVRGT